MEKIVEEDSSEWSGQVEKIGSKDSSEWSGQVGKDNW